MTTATLMIILSIMQFLLVIVQAMAWFIIKSMVKRIEVAEERIIEMKGNYIDRFERIIAGQTEARIELIKEQGIIKEDLVRSQHEVKDQLIETIANLKLFILESLHREGLKSKE